MKKKSIVLIILIIILVIAGLTYFIQKDIKEKGKEYTIQEVNDYNYFISKAKNEQKFGIINKDGKQIVPEMYDSIRIANPEKPVFVCAQGDNTIVKNDSNEEIYTDYKNIDTLRLKNVSTDLVYEKSVLKYKNGDKYGLIDINAKKLTDAIYEEIDTLQYKEGELLVKKDGKYGVINQKGNILLEAKYDKIAADAFFEDDAHYRYDGYIVSIKTDEGYRYGYVSYRGKLETEIKYNELERLSDLGIRDNAYLLVAENGRYGVLENDKQIIPNDYQSISFDNSNQIFIVQKGKKYGVINLKGEKVIEFNYDELQEAKSGIFIFKKNGKYGIIDVDNNEKVSAKYTNITYQEASDMYIAEKENFESDIIDDTFNVKLSGMLLAFNNEEGYIKIKNQENVSYYNFKFEEKHDTEIFANHTLFLRKQNGKYGFVDKDGNVVVDYQYDDATDQNDYGFAGVKKDGKWGSIDANGKIVQEPIYNLDNYLLVNFIGRWHIGEDLNMNYYNQL